MAIMNIKVFGRIPASIGESLICEREIGNCYDTHAVAYGPLLPFLLSTEASITSATRSFAEVITPGEIDALNDPVGSGKTLAEGRDLLSTCLKYFRFDMTNHSVVSSLGLGKNRHDKVTQWSAASDSVHTCSLTR